MPGDVVCLYGDLGSGKTTFTQGIAKTLGLKHLPSSPTFILMQQYKTSKSDIPILYHLDLYRLDTEKEIEQIGVSSLLDHNDGLLVIEWAEKAKSLLPDRRVDVFFSYGNIDDRLIRLNDATGKAIEKNL